MECSANSAVIATTPPAVEPSAACGCRACLTERQERVHLESLGWLPVTATRMILCATCGNKRCPHANDHRNACTGSNEPGQPGSAYE
jgi:hypothetical protein